MAKADATLLQEIHDLSSHHNHKDKADLKGQSPLICYLGGGWWCQLILAPWCVKGKGKAKANTRAKARTKSEGKL
ncbi:hypothetical protein MU1_18920 [Paenibacillus glycanilyticus]|uniref:Uncharacterized protein n=1 Tax=Paenibacillus glycanilyticus TaxID=126569 RepID=A0ABQ6GD39_9BACL|nr:hypothetical protein MU1_18920 [Paenibacillus glycanilyticus]